ncbi:MAG TPA: hypothetical protein VFZ08_09690 [Terriglobia bacterium]|nr:hypothetical protein [Terriglobia bacterium]
MKKSKLLLLLFLLVGIPVLASQKAPKTYRLATPPEPNYKSIDWLVGSWVGKTTSPGAQGQVLLTVGYELGKRFLMLRQEVSLSATDSVPATHEGFMGVLNGGATGGAFNLNLYSSTGFVMHYRVTAKDGQIVFQPEGGIVPPEGWLFRWTIIHTGAGHCVERVDVAPPGKSFFEYYSATLSQVNQTIIKTPHTSQDSNTSDKPAKPESAKRHRWIRL